MSKMLLERLWWSGVNVMYVIVILMEMIMK
jgi:hypothetical protein